MTDIEGVGDRQQRYEVWVRLDGEKELVRMGWADDCAPLVSEAKAMWQIGYVEVRDREDNDKVVDTWKRPGKETGRISQRSWRAKDREKKNRRKRAAKESRKRNRK